MSVLVAAQTLGQESGWQLTPIEYQKILYVAQMIHLAREGKPLFDENYEAWDYGPVVPSLWRAFSHFGRNTVVAMAGVAVFAPESSNALAISDAYCMTHHMRPGQLINFTHRTGGAWDTYYERRGDNAVIPASAMLAEWRELSKPSQEAVGWATRLIDDIEAGAVEYLDDAGQRSFRERLFSQNRA